MSDVSILRRSVDAIHEKLGVDCEIYGVGFSLGANHLLRYVGANPENNGLKAAISVSNPFDCMATCIRLKYTFFGIYDRAIKTMLSRPFI
jgi:predicted alpha/beta-fold hydrolase